MVEESKMENKSTALCSNGLITSLIIHAQKILTSPPFPSSKIEHRMKNYNPCYELIKSLEKAIKFISMQITEIKFIGVGVIVGIFIVCRCIALLRRLRIRALFYTKL